MELGSRTVFGTERGRGCCRAGRSNQLPGPLFRYAEQLTLRFDGSAETVLKLWNEDTSNQEGGWQLVWSTGN